MNKSKLIEEFKRDFSKDVLQMMALSFAQRIEFLNNRKTGCPQEDEEIHRLRELYFVCKQAKLGE